MPADKQQQASAAATRVGGHRRYSFARSRARPDACTEVSCRSCEARRQEALACLESRAVGPVAMPCGLLRADTCTYSHKHVCGVGRASVGSAAAALYSSSSASSSYAAAESNVCTARSSTAAAHSCETAGPTMAAAVAAGVPVGRREGEQPALLTTSPATRSSQQAASALDDRR